MQQSIIAQPHEHHCETRAALNNIGYRWAKRRDHSGEERRKCNGMNRDL